MRYLLTGLAVAAAGLAARSADPAPDALAAQLGADAYAARAAAGRALRALGPAALPALDRVARATAAPPDARDRAARLADGIRRADETARLLVAPLVALDYAGAPLAAAVADLRGRTGVPLDLDPAVADPLRPVTVRLGPVPAWEAVEAFCRAAGLREVVRPDADAAAPAYRTVTSGRGRRVSYSSPEPTPLTPGAVPVVLSDGPAGDLPGDRRTAVRVVALPPGFGANRVDRGTGDVLFHLDVTPLPGARWREAAAVRVGRAEDESGRPVGGAPADDAPPAPIDWDGGVVFGGLGGNVILDDGSVAGPPGPRPNPRAVPVRVRVTDRAVGRLRVLEGIVVGEVTVPDQPLVTVPDLARAVGAPLDGPNSTRFTVLGYEARPDGSTVVKVRREGPSPFAARRLAGFRGRVFVNGRGGDGAPPELGRLRFADAAGKPVPTPGALTVGLSDDLVRRSIDEVYEFGRRSARPAGVAAVGDRTVAVAVPFRLENVRLP